VRLLLTSAVLALLAMPAPPVVAPSPRHAPEASASPVAQRPLWHTGDTWTYLGTDGKPFTLTVLGIAADHYSIERRAGSDVDIVLMSFDFSPNLFARFSWPLAVGKIWSFTTRSRPGNGIGGDENQYVTSLVVDGYGPVTVRAGTFRAFHIKGLQCNVTQQNRCGAFDVWYAPAVKNWIKIHYITSGWWPFAGKSEELLSSKVH
jgi:hypothetical protein